jgi:hypothetical protein
MLDTDVVLSGGFFLFSNSTSFYIFKSLSLKDISTNSAHYHFQKGVSDGQKVSKVERRLVRRLCVVLRL